MYHPAILALEDALKPRGTGLVIRLIHLLEFRCRSLFKLTSKRGTKIVYVELKAMAERYAFVKDNDSLE